MIAPLFQVFVQSFSDDGQTVGLALFQDVFSDPAWGQAYVNSLVISVIVGIIATLLGFALSYGLHFTRIPLGAKKVFSTIFSLPMLLPTITYGYVLLYTFGRQGLLTQILGFQLFDIYGNVGVILGLVIYATPITFLLFSDGMRYIETKYEIVSKLLGDPPFQTFKISILIPLFRVFGISFVQSFFMSFTDFGIPTESDIDEMYARFKEVLLEDIPKYSGVKPGAIKLFDTL